MSKLQSHVTRERIIDAAASCFAERGFRGVTVRELASGLGLHYSLINYHFRSKLDLYREVVARACSSPRYAELPRRKSAKGDSNSRLVKAITQLLSDSLTRRSKNGWECCVVAQECLQGGEMLEKVIAPALRPKFRFISSIIAEVRGNKKISMEDQFAAFGLFAQVDALVTYRPLLAALVPKMRGKTKNLGWCAEQLARSIAGHTSAPQKRSRIKGK